MIVGSGKTATDGIVWLLANGVEPGRIVWVRPRDPWMLNRGVVQPNPAVAIGLAADTMTAAADAESLDDLFLRLEAAGVMLRIDTDVLPTMAKTPTLGAWELDVLRTIENVVRLGHIKHVTRGKIALEHGSVHWRPVAHRALRRVRTAVPTARSALGAGQDPTPDDSGGFPCFNAALAGYVEATRDEIASATGCVRPTPSPTTLPTGRGCRFAEPSPHAPSALSPTLPRGPTAAP